MIGEARAHGLQAMYVAGAVGALQALQEECTSIAQRLALSKIRKLHIFVEHDKVEQIAHDASTKLMERYLQDPDFKVRHFSKMLGYKIKDELFISPRQRQKTFEASIICKDVETSGPYFSPEIMDDAALDIAISHQWGKKALADLCRSRSYRQAIKRISAYVERRWIYDHASALHEVYRTLHSPKGADGRLSRSGLVAVRKELLRRRKPEHQQVVQ